MELNDEQQEAVNHREGPLLVLAGAGSGKTRIVTNRIVRLLETGVEPSQIVAVTFTNRAAGEMAERIAHMTSHRVLTSTFHSLSARILREAIHILGYKRDFAIYDASDAEKLLKSCLAALGYSDKKDLKMVKSAISSAKSDLLEPDETEHAAIFSLYQRKLKEYNALDFDDLIALTVRLFRDHPDVLKIYQDRWRYILVDEYQDTNAAQYTLTRLLAGERCNLCVVGDPDQSIYAWRGANIRNILDFERDYPGARVIKLEQNYRSVNTILQASNAVIENNTERYQKDLWSGLGEGEPIGLFFGSNEREEAAFVVDRIEELHVPYSEIAIFYRTNAQSRIFEDMFLKASIPYVIVGGLSFYERKEVKDILAYLRLILSSSDFISFVRAINVPKRGLGPTALERLEEEAGGRPILEVAEHPGAIKLSAKQRDNLKAFVTLIDGLRDLAKERGPVSFLIREVIERSGYLEFLKEDPDSFDDRKANLDELIAKGAESTDLLQFMEELSLRSSVDDLEKTEESVRMMTVHNGKGLEFELVFIVGLEEELFPHINSLDNIEEERRLFYVGMTRAKRRLFLSGAYYRLMWGNPRVMQPSRFLHEIPANLITSRR